MEAREVELDGVGEKSQLEHVIFLVQREHNLKEATQTYETARLDLHGIDDQEDLLLANLRLENALDDLKLLNSRLEILTLQLDEEKGKVTFLEAEALTREAYISTKEADISQKNSALQQRTKELEVQINEILSSHCKEVENIKAGHEVWKSQLSNELVSLVRERNFVWNQLKRIEANYYKQLQTKEEELQRVQIEIQGLRESLEAAQTLADEKGVELTIVKLELQKAEDECYDLKQTIARISAEDPHTSSTSQLEPQEVLNNVAVEQSAKKDELQRAQQKIEELTRENANLRAMHAEMEAKSQKPGGKQVQTARKAMVTRNLTAQLENVANTAAATKDDASSKKTRSVTKEKSRKRPAKRKAAETTGGKLRKARK